MNNKNICTNCTTPAILCPNGNEPKNQVVDCGSKNYTAAPTHTECKTCYSLFHKQCEKPDPSFCKYTAPVPAPKVTDTPINNDKFKDEYNRLRAEDWIATAKLCRELGMKETPDEFLIDDVLSFIRSLAQRAGEGYVRGVNDACAILDKQKLPDDSDITWRPDCPKGFAKQIRKELNIKAVTTRADTRPDDKEAK